MSIRQIQITAPRRNAEDIRQVLEEEPTNTFDMITGCGEEEKCLFLVITRTGNVQNILDRLRKMVLFDGKETALVTIVEAEGALPYPEQEKETTAKASREELLTGVSARAEASHYFFLLTILSTIVAYIGFIENSPAIVIAAMVLAPLLGPSIAAGFGSLIGNLPLWNRAMKASISGIGMALIVSIILGFIYPVDLTSTEVASRTVFSWSILVLALVSGVAGALTFTTALSEALVGVMVGIALLPPIVAVGCTLAQGDWIAARGAILIFGANLSGLNLASILTFRLQGIGPRYWYEKRSAKKVTMFSIITWSLILAVIILYNLSLSLS